MEKFSNEKQDCYPFWNWIFKNCCYVENPDAILRFEVPVRLKDSIGYIDAWISTTKIIIEQKSRGKKLDKPEKQSDGEMLDPFGQAKRYDNFRGVEDKANWIITSNFEEIWIYNLKFERPERHVLKIRVDELQDWDLRFLVDAHRAEVFSEEQISEEAGKLVQLFRDPFLEAIDRKNPD